MSLVTLSNPVALANTRIASGAAGVTNFACALTNKKIVWVIVLPTGKAIDTLGVYITAQAGAPKVRLSLQGVTSRTTPADGVILGGGTAKADWTGGSDTLNAFNLKTLDTRYVNNTGAPQLIAVVFEYQGSGQDFDGSNSVTIGHATTSCDSQTKSVPWTATRTTATWTVVTSQPVLIAKDTVTGDYVQNLFTAASPASQATSSGTADGYGCKFTAEVGGRIYGVEVAVRTASGASFSINVRKNGVHNQNVAWQENGLLSANTSAALIRIPFTTPVDVAIGDVLHIHFCGATVTNQTYFGKMTFASQADRAAMWGSALQGTNIQYINSWDITNPDSVTDEPANFYPVVPLYDKIDIRSAGGGGGNGNGNALLF